MSALDIHTMKPGDIYENARGERWTVLGYWTEPVVIMRRGDGLEAIVQNTDRPHDPDEMLGGYRGLMWKGFKLVQKADPPSDILKLSCVGGGDA